MRRCSHLQLDHLFLCPTSDTDLARVFRAAKHSSTWCQGYQNLSGIPDRVALAVTALSISIRYRGISLLRSARRSISASSPPDRLRRVPGTRLEADLPQSVSDSIVPRLPENTPKNRRGFAEKWTSPAVFRTVGDLPVSTGSPRGGKRLHTCLRTPLSENRSPGEILVAWAIPSLVRPAHRAGSGRRAPFPRARQSAPIRRALCPLAAHRSSPRSPSARSRRATRRIRSRSWL